MMSFHTALSYDKLAADIKIIKSNDQCPQGPEGLEGHIASLSKRSLSFSEPLSELLEYYVQCLMLSQSATMPPCCVRLSESHWFAPVCNAVQNIL